MALKLGSLFFDVFANTSDMKKGMDDVDDQAKKTGRSFNKLGTIIKAVIAAEGARRIIMLADNMRVLDTRLKNLTKTQSDYERSSQRLLSTANETGQAFRDIVVFFERSTRALEDLGATNSQVLQFTDSIQKLGVLGGNSVDEIANGTRQLNQSLQGGIVRAEEFNSIIENTPMIANAIAENLGKTTGELRQMVLNGTLTSEKVFTAILEQSESINEKFEDFPRSITQASNALVNEFGQALKTVDSQAGGLTNFVTDVIDQLALGIRTINNELKDTEFDRVSEEIENLQEKNQDLIDDLERRREFGFPSWIEGIFGSKKTNEEIRAEIDANQAKLNQLLETQKRLAGIEDEMAKGGTAKQETVDIEPTNDQQGIANFRIDVLGEQLLAVEEKYKEHYERLSQIVITSTEERTALEAQLEKKKQAEISSIQMEMAADRVRILQTSLSQVSGFMESLTTLLERAGAKNKAIMKAAFLAQKAVQVVSIIANAYEAGAKVTAATANPAAGAVVTGIGLANAAIVAGLSVGEAAGGRQQGGPTSPNTLYDVTENGDPEMFVSGNKQFLMTGSRGGKVISGGDMQKGGGSGSTSVTVVNNTGVAASARTEYITQNELRVILDAEAQKTIQNAQDAIAAGIDENSGPVNESLNRNTQTIRRLR